MIQLLSSLCCFMCLSFQSSCIAFAPMNFSAYVSLFESVFSIGKSSTAGWMSLMGLLVLDGKVTRSVSMHYVCKRGWLAKCENTLWFGIYRTSRDCHHSSTSHHNPVYNHCWARAHHYSFPTKTTRPSLQPTRPWVPPVHPTRRSHRPQPTARSDQDAPDICEGNFDTVTVLRGEMFVFKVNNTDLQ